MADTTPARAPYRNLDVDASARLAGDDADDDAMRPASDGSQTPGSPVRRGGRTLWTKADDEDDSVEDDTSDLTRARSGSAAGARDDALPGEGEGEAVVTQVTSAAGLAAPAYGANRNRNSGLRAGLRGGGGLFGAFSCCFRGGEADGGYGAGEDARRYRSVSQLAPHSVVPGGGAMHVGPAFLPPPIASDASKPCLVLDLDETLVHSSFKPVPNPDYVIPVEIDGAVTDVYVLKRPWVDYFMERAGERWEVVVFTASLAKYADPLLDLLDKKTGVIRHRLFRESCYPFQGNYVKDLTSLGREMTRCVIVDNSPHSYAFQPQNALPVASFIDDPRDNDLLDLLPYLDELAEAKDVTETLVRNDGFVPRRTFHSRGLPVPHHRRNQ